MSIACLLLHGYCGSPFEVQPLVPGLEAAGYVVDLPTLPGHDTNIDDFRRTFFSDWLNCARERYAALCRTHERVLVAGFSMGGALTLALAEEQNPAPPLGIVCLSTPAYIYQVLPPRFQDWRLPFIGLLKHIIPVLKRPPVRPESRVIAPYRGYDTVDCLSQLHSMIQGIANVRSRLAAVSCPILLMHDIRDVRAWPESALIVAANVASEDVTLQYTRMRENITSHHMITTHQETREQVAAAVSAFARRLAVQR